MNALNSLYGENELRVDGPRWTLCEFWQRGKDLLVCCANLRKSHDGGPLTVRLGGFAAEEVTVHSLLVNGTATVEVRDGSVTVERVPHFCAVEVKGAFPDAAEHGEAPPAAY